MAQAGIPARPRRRAAPWWEELDREAFRDFPADRPRRAARDAVAPRPARPVATLGEPRPRAKATLDDPRPRTSAWLDEPPPRAANGRRTIVIQGRGAERNLPVSPRRPNVPRHERPGFKPDRAAMWAVFLGLLLILVAATSAHAATFL
jgi:hypothetical protein